MKNPPIDPKFYELDAAQGMTDDEIQADWDAYCAGMNEFSSMLAERDREQDQSGSKPLVDVLTDIIATFSAPLKGRSANGTPQNSENRS